MPSIINDITISDKLSLTADNPKMYPRLVWVLTVVGSFMAGVYCAAAYIAYGVTNQ